VPFFKYGVEGVQHRKVLRFKNLCYVSSILFVDFLVNCVYAKLICAHIFIRVHIAPVAECAVEYCKCIRVFQYLFLLYCL